VTFSESLVAVAAIAGLCTVAVYFIQALWPQPQPTEALQDRALAELALLRDEVSKLRAETLRDRDELRTEVSKHERAFIETTHRVNDSIKEVSKLSLAYGQMRK
jgi:C4-dicarboxylate-specific signal transduction histidine kinase